MEEIVLDQGIRREYMKSLCRCLNRLNNERRKPWIAKIEHLLDAYLMAESYSMDVPQAGTNPASGLPHLRSIERMKRYAEHSSGRQYAPKEDVIESMLMDYADGRSYESVIREAGRKIHDSEINRAAASTEGLAVKCMNIEYKRNSLDMFFIGRNDYDADKEGIMMNCTMDFNEDISSIAKENKMQIALSRFLDPEAMMHHIAETLGSRPSYSELDIVGPFSYRGVGSSSPLSGFCTSSGSFVLEHEKRVREADSSQIYSTAFCSQETERYIKSIIPEYRTVVIPGGQEHQEAADGI